MENCLNGELTQEYDGGHANIFRGKHKDRPVAIKIVRLYLTSDFDKRFSVSIPAPHIAGFPVDQESQEFCREVVAWRHLRHPHILPLLGVNIERHQLAMISEWMDNGNINEYVKGHEGVNRVQLVSNDITSRGDKRNWLIQLVDVANGLEYMHGLHMVHGDLKGV